MWVLESDGNAFSSKRIWLRPGSRHFLGRTKPSIPEDAQNRKHYVDHKSVSRKHLLIEVQTVPQTSWVSPNSRATVSITDTSKTGTILNGTKFAGSTRTLPNSEAPQIFQLGTCEQTFRIVWVPIVITCVSFHRFRNSVDDPAEQICSLLGPADIKFVPTFEPGVTTHVVVNKRNTSTGLQALLDGSFLVMDTFVEALAHATAPAPFPDGISPGVGPSPLEQDFNAHWPDPIAHLPPVGKEPIPRPAEMFRPNSSRRDVFHGFLFVFLDLGQYESLHETISLGTGKAVHFDVQQGTSRAEQVLELARKVLVNPSSGDRLLESIVVVRARQESGWVGEFQKEIEAVIRKDLLPQNALLDVVLTADTTKLRELRPPQRGDDEEDLDETVIEPAAEVKREFLKSESSSQRRTGRRGEIPVRRFRGFDDSDDDDLPLAQIAASSNSSNRATNKEIRNGVNGLMLPKSGVTPSVGGGLTQQRPNLSSARRRVPFCDNSDSDTNGNMVSREMPHLTQTLSSVPKEPVPLTDAPPSSMQLGAAKLRGISGQKRKLTLEEDGEPADPGDLLDKLMPAAAAIKKRRIEERKEEEAQAQRGNGGGGGPDAGNDDGGDAQGSEADEKPDTKPSVSLEPGGIFRKKKVRPAAELDVLGAAEARRRAEEDNARMDGEAIREAIEDLTSEQMRNLVIVEEADLVVRRRPGRDGRAVGGGSFDDHSLLDGSGHGGDDGNIVLGNVLGRRGWDERWNGRKNFKGFRPKGSAAAGSDARSRVSRNRRANGRERVILETEEATSLARQDNFVGGEMTESDVPLSATVSHSADSGSQPASRFGARSRFREESVAAGTSQRSAAGSAPMSNPVAGLGRGSGRASVGRGARTAAGTRSSARGKKSNTITAAAAGVAAAAPVPIAIEDSESEADFGFAIRAGVGGVGGGTNGREDFDQIGEDDDSFLELMMADESLSQPGPGFGPATAPSFRKGGSPKDASDAGSVSMGRSRKRAAPPLNGGSIILDGDDNDGEDGDGGAATRRGAGLGVKRRRVEASVGGSAGVRNGTVGAAGTSDSLPSFRSSVRSGLASTGAGADAGAGTDGDSGSDEELRFRFQRSRRRL